MLRWLFGKGRWPVGDGEVLEEVSVPTLHPQSVCFPQEASLKCPLAQIQQDEGQGSKEEHVHDELNEGGKWGVPAGKARTGSVMAKARERGAIIFRDHLRESAHPRPQDTNFQCDGI